MIEEMRQRRYQENKISIPENFQSTAREVRLSLFADTIDLMAAIVDDALWSVHVDP